MSALDLSEVTLDAEVPGFLERHNAAAPLQTVCAIVRRCFPKAGPIHVQLTEDPDEDNHTWIVLETTLQGAESAEEFKQQKDRWYDEQARLPWAYHPFSFSLDIKPYQE
jgi:hypothetical protein